jgi:hypothetical protein
MARSDCLSFEEVSVIGTSSSWVDYFPLSIARDTFSSWVESPLFPPHLGSFPSTWFWGRQISFHKSPFSLFLVGVQILTYYHCSEFGKFNLGLLGLFLFPFLNLYLLATTRVGVVSIMPLLFQVSLGVLLRYHLLALDAPSSTFWHSSTS